MAIYVKLTSGSSPAQTWSGSNLGVPFDNGAIAGNVTIQAFSDAPMTVSIAAGDVDWVLHNAPAGTSKNQAWFNGANFGSTLGVNPLLSAVGPTPNFLPDIEGTWFFRCTRTDTSESIDFVVATNNVRTNTRIPAAGETTEADQDTTNHAYPGGSPSGQGWAKDRDYALDVFDDLTTSGGVQLCYWDNAGFPIGSAPWNAAPAGLKAGASLALTGTMHTINHTTGEQVPIVTLADGDTNFEYVGLFKADTTGNNGTTSAITADTLVWVSRSGVVEAAPNVIDTTAPSAGEVLYLSKTPGILIRGNDRFSLGATKPLYEVPACLVLNSATSGKVLTLPDKYMGGIPDISKTFRFNGIGDFSGLRVGSNDIGGTVAEERVGCVEMIATNNDAVTIIVGTVCMLTLTGTTVQAYIADSNSISTVGAAKREGIVGVAIENVTAAAIGHFCIYGPVLANSIRISASATASVSPGTPVYVGSSKLVGAQDQSGVAVLFDEVAGNAPADLSLGAADNLSVFNNVIPIGQLSNVGGSNVIMVGIHQATGHLDALYGGLQNQTLPTGVPDPAVTTSMVPAGNTYNKSGVQIQDSAVTYSAQSTILGVDIGALTPDKSVIKVAGSGADDAVAQVDMYECKIPGTILYESSGSSSDLDGEYDATTTFTGSELDPSSANTLYGTFNYDLRCGVGINTATHGMFNNATRLKVYGITTGPNITAITIQAKLRFNTLSMIDGNGGVPLPVAVGAGNLPTTNETPDYPFWTRTINTPVRTLISANNTTRPKQICFDMALYDDGTAVASAAGNKVGSSAKPNLGLLSSGPVFDDTSVANKPVQDSFTNPILGIDVELVRTDANVTTFLVTEVVLESEKRLHFPYARSAFEACWPAYAFQTISPSGTLAVQNETAAITGSGPLVGVRNDTGSTAGAGISTITGFIPRDARAQTSPDGAIAVTYALRVDGKFSGPTNVAAPNNEVLGLKFYVKEVEVNDDLNKTIASATPDVAGTVIPTIPVLSTAGSGEIANTIHACPFSSPTNDNVIGWWFTVTRETSGAAGAPMPSGVYSGDINGAELFYLMTNVQLQGTFNDDGRLNNTL